MINGTKLLNVAGMTRGRRDGILKSEKVRHVVKIGPMHLKGVWWVSKFCLNPHTLTGLKDSIRQSIGFRQQGKDHGSALSTLCS